MSNLNETPDEKKAPQAPFLIKLLIVVFSLVYITIAIYLVADCWVLDQSIVKRVLGIPIEQKLPPMFISAIYAVLGAILGAGALDVVSFHRFNTIKRDFQATHVWGYFFGPWLASILGLIVFALLQSGLLVFSGGKSGESQTEVSNLGYLAVGFLSGFGWHQAIERIREAVNQFFSSSHTNKKFRDAKGSLGEKNDPQVTPEVPLDGGKKPNALGGKVE